MNNDVPKEKIDLMEAEANALREQALIEDEKEKKTVYAIIDSDEAGMYSVDGIFETEVDAKANITNDSQKVVSFILGELVK